MAAKAHLIVVGKLKDPHLKYLEEQYLKRLQSPKLNIYEVKDSSESPHIEAEQVLAQIAKIGSKLIILLKEVGQTHNSAEFSQWMERLIEGSDEPIFVIAGALGHGDSLLKLPHQALSLSKLTFPHKIARLLFIEQYYRAQTIKNNHPYHN